MLRPRAVAGAVALMLGAVACGVPNTATSQPSGMPSAVVAVASSLPASVPVVAKPPKPLGSPPADVGDLEQFVQSSATTWWATVVGNLSDQLFLVRTIDAGQHWQDVTPPFGELHVNDAVSSYVLSANVAWLDADAEPTTPQLFRTLDGGKSWQQLGTIPADCTLQFVDVSNGWCYELPGSMGSAGVEIYRTEDGGVTWRLISRTTGDGTQQTPDALPFGCGKSLTFASQTVGWASSFCNGGQPYLETSTDGGMRWHAVTPVPLPPNVDGVGLTLPAVDAGGIAVARLGGGPEDQISTSTDGGRSWRTHRLPTGASGQYWTVDLIDPTHWRATDGSVIMSTDNAGAYWQRWTPNTSMHDQYGTLELDFISPDDGSASDPADRTPLWSTTDGGHTWSKVVIDAGPYVLK